MKALGYQARPRRCARSMRPRPTMSRKTERGWDLEFVADWWGVETTRGVEEKEFIQKLTQRYSYHKVMEEIRKKGYTIDTEEAREDEIFRSRQDLELFSWKEA